MPAKEKPKSSEEMLRRLSVDDINNLYRSHEINNRDWHMLLLMKAHATTGELLERNGYFEAIGTKIVEHFMEGWENVKEAATHDAEASTKDAEAPLGERIAPGLGKDLFNAMKASWGTVQMLTSVINAVGDVHGQVAENTALRFGAPQWLARGVGIATNVAHGFIPIGAAAKGGVQLVQKGQKALGIGAKVGETADEVAMMAKVFGEGLAAEGIPEATKVVAQAVETGASKEAASGFREAMKEMGRQDRAFAEAVKLPETSSEYREAFKDLRSLARTAVAGDRAAQNAFTRQSMELFSGLAKGDKLSYNKTFMEMLHHWDPENVAKGDILAAMTNFAKDIAEMPLKNGEGFITRAQTAFAEANNQRGSVTAETMANIWYGFREAYVQSLLPLAWAPSIMGNSIAVGLDLAERFSGAVFSVSPKGLVVQEPFYKIKGMTLATGDAIKAFGNAYTAMGLREIAAAVGRPLSEVRKMSSQKLYDELQAAGVNPGNVLNYASKLDFIPGEIPGPLGRIIRFGGDTVRGVDNFYKVLLQRGSDYAWALRDGMQRGLSGRVLTDHIDNLTAPFGPKPLAQVVEGREIALMGTYQNDLGPIAQFVQRNAQGSVGFLWFPFMKTFVNLTKYAWNRTPGLQLLSQSLYRDIAAGGARADMAVGRLVMANLMGSFYYELAKEGFITGSGPVDPALQKAWLATHERYSVRTPTGYIPFKNDDPLTAPMGFVADLTAVAGTIDEPSFLQGFQAVTFSIMHNFGDNGFWPHASDMLDAVQGMKEGKEWSGKARDFFLSPLTNLRTLGALPARVAAITDPVMKETREYIDSVTSKQPGWSKAVPPVRDGYGDIITPPQAAGNPWFGLGSPMWPKYKQQTEDAVKLEGDKLQAKLPYFNWTVGGSAPDEDALVQPQEDDRVGVPLTNAQHDRRIQIYKRNIRHAEFGLQATMDSKDYQAQTPAGRRSLFEAAAHAAWTAAGLALQAEDKELGKKVLANSVRALLPVVQPDERSTVVKQGSEEIAGFDQSTADELDNIMKWGVLDIPADETMASGAARPVLQQDLSVVVKPQPEAPK